MAFGDVIRARRTEMCIGLNDMATRLGISAAYWSRIERDLEGPPRDELIEKAAAILALRLDDLFVDGFRQAGGGDGRAWRDVCFGHAEL